MQTTGRRARRLKTAVAGVQAASPAYSPVLNPVERVWLPVKERFLSHRLPDDDNAIADAACNAWNRLLAEAGRIKLCSHPWNPPVKV
jgi:transposase